MRESRRRVVDVLRVHDGLTVDELAERVGLTRNAVVNHLTALQRDGAVAIAGMRGGKGRPSQLYALTDRADRFFPEAYDELAMLLLDELKRADRDAATRTLRAISRRWKERDVPALAHTGGRDRLQRVTAVLAKRGFMPRLVRRDGSVLLRHYNCPVKRVGSRHPEVCEAVTRWIGALLDAPVRQVACASRGDRFCSYTWTARRSE
jgi:predicted ArsR family transcriptional regulator